MNQDGGARLQAPHAKRWRKQRWQEKHLNGRQQGGSGRQGGLGHHNGKRSKALEAGSKEAPPQEAQEPCKPCVLTSGAGARAEPVPRCVSEGCVRPAADGGKYQHCCRTCRDGGPAGHGPKCEARFQEAQLGAAPPAHLPALGQKAEEAHTSRAELLHARSSCAEDAPGEELLGRPLRAVPTAELDLPELPSPRSEEGEEEEKSMELQPSPGAAADSGGAVASAVRDAVALRWPEDSSREAACHRARELLRAAYLKAAWKKGLRLKRAPAEPEEARDPMGYLEAIKSKEAWRDWIEMPGKLLEKLQYLEFQATKKWDFQCIICRKALTNGASSHMPGQKHLAELLKAGEKGYEDACGMRTWWVQSFSTHCGSYFLLNHLTGETSWDDTGEVGRQAEPLPESEAKPGKSQPGKTGNAETPVEADPVLKAALVWEPGRPTAVSASPSGYSVVDRWETWDTHSLTDPCKPWENKSGTCKFGWKPDGKRQDSFSWSLEWKSGSWLVVLGFNDGQQDQGPRVKTISGQVNNKKFSEWKGQFFNTEVELLVTIPESGYLRIQGQCLPYLRYVHVLPPERASSTKKGTWNVPRPPAFQKDCHGVPADWNAADTAPKTSPESGLYWGKRARSALSIGASPGGGSFRAQADINAMLEFLKTRKGSDGASVLQRLGPPLKQEDGWYSLQWKEFTKAKQEKLGRSNWVRAWHGCKVEGLYSILYHGRLRASSDKSKGDRYFAGAPGIYVHKDATSRKAENYVRFVPLCGDGIFWAAKWEVVVDRARRVRAPHQTDQWIQEDGSVQLAALWVCCRSAEAMRDGDAVAREWRGELEANPLDPCWG